MRCPTLNELPPAPLGKTGWPWTEESSGLPDHQKDGSPWTRISIVTPSYNQGQFIEETIRSVLLQGYPNLEYIIIDGGSNDGSIEIIRKYERWLDFWISEKDDGQGDAINKGLERATGPVANWLNSDDLLYIGALKRVATAYASDETAILYNGSALRIDSEGVYGSPFPARSLLAEDVFEGKVPLPQPAIFFRRDHWLRHGKLKRHLYYAIDTDLFSSAILIGHACAIKGPPLAMIRVHEAAKTAQATALKPMFLERHEIFSKLSRSPNTPKHFKRHIEYGLNREAFRLARVILKERGQLFQALRWFILALRYSPKKTLYRFPDILLGNFHK